jgi:O-antigen/teichoic acid export membrane protein
VSETASLRHKVRRSLPWSVAAGALQIALSLLSMVLLVRYLEPQEYGVWSILAALSTVVNLFASFGFGEFVIRFVPGIEQASDVARTIWSVVARRMALATLASVVLVATFGFYAARFELTAYGLHFAIYQLVVIFGLGSLYLQYAMNARFMQRELVLRAIPTQMTLIGLTLFGIWRRETLLYFVIVTSAVTVASFALNAYIVGRRYRPSWAALFGPVPQTPAQVRYRRLSYLDEFGVNFLSTDIARYLVSYFSNNVEVAIYSVATTIVARLQLFLPGWMLKSLTDAAFYSRYEQTGDPADLARMFRLLYGVNTVASFAFVAAFFPFGRELLELVFREAYGAAYAPVLILLLFLVLHFMPVGLVAKALQRPEILIYSKVAVLLNIGLGIPLTIRYGATGMVLATALSVALKNAIMLVLVRRDMKLPLPWRATLRSALAASVAGGIALVAKPWLPPPVALPVGLVVACAVYAVAVRVLQPLDAEDRAILAAMVPAAAHPFLRRVLGR